VYKTLESDTIWYMKKKHLYPILDSIQGSKNVSELGQGQLKDLSDELRNFLIHTVSEIGGHFGSNLGVVELAVALHYVFNTPQDKIIWDVGHQAYAHKVLTGRRNQLHTIRQKGGLTPFPARQENENDAFGVGHSSTSISAGIGMALAHRNQKKRFHVTAVIGDGALTGGMAYEAINHAGDVGADILVILNDNKMSISPNVGAMTRYLTRLISSPAYTKIRLKGRKALRKMPTMQEFARRIEGHAKGLVTPGTMFEEMGFEYFGPVDGNDSETLSEILMNLKNIRGPRFLHVVTKKGKGCSCAEKDALALHAVTAFNPETGKKKQNTKTKTYTDVFSEWILEMARLDKRLHAVTPAMREGSGLVTFHKKYPKRFHDVGIAEQHAVTFAAGLACEGKKPVMAIYSTFLQRAYDQLIHDVALQNLDVLFAVDRAGLVGPDGATHAGSFDFSFLRAIPNMVIMTPANAEECKLMLQAGFEFTGPVAIRYPRAKIHKSIKSKDPVKIGKASMVRSGHKVAVLSFGALLDRCLNVAESLGCTVVNMRSVKPLDENMLQKLSQDHKIFVTVEDNAVLGGAGSAVNEFVLNNNIDVRVKNIGLPDMFLEHGTRDEILTEAGLDEEGIAKTLALLV